MLKFDQNTTDFIQESRQLISLCINDHYINTTIALYGFDTTKILEAESLLNLFEGLYDSPQFELENQYLSNIDFRNKQFDAYESYLDLVAIAKIVFKKNIKAQQILDLNRQCKKSFNGWMSQALQFCNNLIANPEFIICMEEFGQGVAQIQAVKQLIVKAQMRAEVLMRENGADLLSTKERDEIYDLLYEWVTDFKVIIGIALKNDPISLEKLGILDNVIQENIL